MTLVRNSAGGVCAVPEAMAGLGLGGPAAAETAGVPGGALIADEDTQQSQIAVIQNQQGQ